MKKIGILFALYALISGCTTVRNQPMDAKAAASLKGQTVTYTVRTKPDFAAMTAGKAAFAVIGAFAMISEGNKIISANDVDDPARLIALGLTKSLASANATQMTASPANVDGTDIEQIVASAKNARFIVDVQTVNWNFAYFPTDWTHYRVMYSAKARLIDAQSKGTIAEGFCSRVPVATSNAPTYDELVLNGAAGLKRELAVAAAECLTKFKSEMLASVTTAKSGDKATPIAMPSAASVTDHQPTTYAVLAAPAPLPAAAPAPASVTPASEKPVAATAMPATPVSMIDSGEQQANIKIQTIEFRAGVSSFSVERIAKEYGCNGGKGAGLITDQGPVEVYRMACDSGKNFLARCEQRQCIAMR